MIDVHDYCRDVEAYLCRRNGGHLIRVVGPAFDVVKAWADDGVPLSVAHAGIDRTVDRAARKATRRRPIPVEFCDADVRDAFDQWRRAVGTTAPGGDSAPARKERLVTHVERALGQLAMLQQTGRVLPALAAAVADAHQALDRLAASSATARGATRDAIIGELARVDAALAATALAAIPAADRAAFTRAAASELEPFRQRLAAAQWNTAVEAATARLIRLHLGLPAIAFDA